MKKDDRLYAKFTINFPHSAKIAILSDAAFRALVEMVCWSREQLTDGRIPEAYAEKRWGLTVLDELVTNHVERPSVVRLGGGDYQVHDFAEHQTTTAEIEARRREISAKRAAAGRASGEARRNKKLFVQRLFETKRTNTNKTDTTSSHVNDSFPRTKQTNANPETETETETKTSSGHLERVTHVSSGDEAAEHARTTELAMSERSSLSSPVSISATRLVAAVTGNKISPADQTILRIKASEALHQGRTADDITDCLRIWLTKPDLGPHALLCCLTEVDKRKLPTHTDQKGLQWLALGRQNGTTP